MNQRTLPIIPFFAAPVLGSLADARGRRPILLLSQAGTLVSWLVFAAGGGTSQGCDGL